MVGSELIGQTFTGDQYFHGRPSAAGADPNDPSKRSDALQCRHSSGSNLGPTSEGADRAGGGRRRALGAERTRAPVPVDLVTTSGSGLDPDITPAAAVPGAARRQRARLAGRAGPQLWSQAHTEDRTLGLLGEPRVNVLDLNLALDACVAPRDAACAGIR